MSNIQRQIFTLVMRVKKAEKEETEKMLRNLTKTGGPSGHQKLQACDVCGAYLSRLDNDRRLADHSYGKMHLGYAQMRKSYDALAKVVKGHAPSVRDAYAPSEDRNGCEGGDNWGGGFGGGGGYGGGGGRDGRSGGRGPVHSLLFSHRAYMAFCTY
jgi:uncharacterized membrane protein YgcG